MRITLTQLMVSTVIGVLPDEQAHPQVLGLDLSVTLSSDAALRSDALPDTLDYSVLAVAIRQWAATHTFLLLEGFVGAFIPWVLATFPMVKSLDVSVTKWGCVPSCHSVTVSDQGGAH